MNYVKYARDKETICLQEVINLKHVWVILYIQNKSFKKSKVDKGEFNFKGEEIKAIVKSRVVDKSEFKDDGSSLKTIFKSRVANKSDMKSDCCELKVIFN